VLDEADPPPLQYTHTPLRHSNQETEETRSEKIGFSSIGFEHESTTRSGSSPSHRSEGVEAGTPWREVLPRGWWCIISSVHVLALCLQDLPGVEPRRSECSRPWIWAREAEVELIVGKLWLEEASVAAEAASRMKKPGMNLPFPKCCQPRLRPVVWPGMNSPLPNCCQLRLVFDGVGRWRRWRWCRAMAA
jgi:hypothetical protein